MNQSTIGDDSVGLFGVLTASTDIETIVEQMRDKAYSDGIEFEQWYDNIFSPELRDIRKLPPALLDTKEALPPIALLPTDKGSLVVWLQRLMLTVPQDVNYDILIEGWRNRKSAGRAFNEHVEDLWFIRNWKPYFFESLVGGRLQPLIRYLRDADAQQYDRIKRALIRQSTIWCAHDVQMVIARLYRETPFGKLVETRAPRHVPERVLNAMRRRLAALEALLDIFFVSPDWRIEDIDPPALRLSVDLTKHHNKEIRKIAKRVSKQNKTGIFGSITSFVVTNRMKEIAGILRNGQNVMITRARSEVTTNVEPKFWAKEWYGLPSALSAATVIIRRLVQFEQEASVMIEEWIATGSRPNGLRRSHALRAYDTPPRGTDARVSSLLRFYRENLVGEHLDERDATEERTRKALASSKAFLLERGERYIEDHHGDIADPHRSFYLLDIIPEHRFCISGPDRYNALLT